MGLRMEYSPKDEKEREEMKKVSIFLAEGFEEVEALTPADLLRRAGAEVTLAAVGEKKEVSGSHGIAIIADQLFTDMDFADMDLLVLPGGMPGTLNLKACEPLLKLLKEHDAEGKKLAAICAAPTVLGYAGLLKGKKATCYPGCEEGLTGAIPVTDPVVTDGTITTSRGVGTAIPFALSLIAELYGTEKAYEIAKSIVYEGNA